MGLDFTHSMLSGHPQRFRGICSVFGEFPQHVLQVPAADLEGTHNELEGYQQLEGN